jgi:acetyl-CoA synthetase
VRALAAGLKNLGLERGDRVGYLMEPGIEAVVTMIALSYMGAVIMPLFSGFGVDPILARLASCDARALIVTSGFRRRGKWINTADVAIAARKLHPVEFLILKMAEGETVPEGAVAWNSLPVSPVPDLAAEPMETNEPVMVFYTFRHHRQAQGHGSRARRLSAQGDARRNGPLRHQGGRRILLACRHGMGRGCADHHRRVDAWGDDDLLRRRAGCSGLVADVADHRAPQDHPFRHGADDDPRVRRESEAATAGDLSSIRLMITGGEVIDPEHFAWHAKHFGRGIAPAHQLFGRHRGVERPRIERHRQADSSGRLQHAHAGVEVDVVNAEGKPVVDEVGELAVLAPFVGMTRSFWQDDERYLDTYWRTVPGIWIHGDLAIRKPTGDFFLRGRSDDTLKLAGKRIGPAEIENVLMELPGVSECASIGVDDPAKGQMLVVFVIPSGGCQGRQGLRQGRGAVRRDPPRQGAAAGARAHRHAVAEDPHGEGDAPSHPRGLYRHAHRRPVVARQSGGAGRNRSSGGSRATQGVSRAAIVARPSRQRILRQQVC